MVAPSRQSASTPLSVTTDVDDFRRLLARSSAVPAKLRTDLRRNIRNVGKAVLTDMQAEVLKPPLRQGKHPQHTGLRQRIAAGMKVSILTGNTKVGVQITSRGPLAKGWDNPKGIRHPVYGDTAAWAVTYGRPYFRSRLPLHRAVVEQAVTAAVTEALASMEGP